MFKKTHDSRHSMTTPPASPSLLYSSGSGPSHYNDSRMDKRQLVSSMLAVSPPLSPLHSLSQTRDQPISSETGSVPPLSLGTTNQHTVLYSGDMMIHSPQSRFNRQKRCYCVLTPTNLIRFKSFDKARKAYPSLNEKNLPTSIPQQQQQQQQQQQSSDQKTLVSLEYIFAVYKVQASSVQTAIRINYVDSEDLSKQPGALTLIPMVGNNGDNTPISLISIWIHALRTALEPYLPGLVTIGSAEQFAAIERTKKQNDQTNANHPMMIHKVILKTTKSAPKPTTSLSTSNAMISHIVPSSAGSSTHSPSLEQKDIYLPVIFLLGHNSIYILPSKSDHDDYRRYVSRDRYGLLAVQNIVIHDGDDSLTIDVCTTHGPSHRLKLISSVGRLLVCAIQKAIQRLVPHFPSAPYSLVCPSLAQRQRSASTGSTASNSHPSSSDTAPTSHWLQSLSQPWQQQKIMSSQKLATSSTILTFFDSVLMAYCAALNLDKRRFRYVLEKSQRHQQQQKPRLFSIQFFPSNEINGNFSSYSKMELIALFRSLRHIDYFETISFKDIRLTPLATWLVTKEDSWTQHDTNNACFPTMLANELFLLLSHNNQLRCLDLSECFNNAIGPVSNDISPSSLGLVRLPSTISLTRTNTIMSSSPVINSSSQQQYQQQVSKFIASDCQQCSVQAILLAMQTNKYLGLSSLILDGHPFHEQDSDLLVQIMATPPATLETGFLRHLSLRKTRLTSAAMEDLLLAIVQGPSREMIERVDLQENDGFISSEVFGEIWHHCTRLSHFGVTCHFRSGESLRMIQQYPKVLNELDLSGSQLDDQHLLELCGWLTHHANTLRPPTKTQFDLCLVLTRCGLHGQHVHRLLHAVSVPHHRRLQFTLKLGDNPLTTQVVYQPWLWSSLAKCGPSSLVLQRVGWESVSLRELFEALIQNKAVEHLDLSYGIVDKSTGSKLALSLEDKIPNNNSNSNNTTNPVSSQRLSSSSAATVKDKGDTEQSTNVSSAPTFDSSTVQALANLLGKMTRLTTFCMDGDQREDIYSSAPQSGGKGKPRMSKMTDAGHLLSSTFRYLSLGTIAFSSTLTTISIKNHGLGDPTIQLLCQWGKSCPSLQSLHVDGNSITIAGFRALLGLAQHNSSVCDIPRPELDFRREIHRLESQARQLQESEGELQYLVIHMVGVDSRRAHTLIEDQAAAREAIMIDRSQLPIVADQLDQQVKTNATLQQRNSRHMTLQPYWPANNNRTVPTTIERPMSTSSISSSTSSLSNSHQGILPVTSSSSLSSTTPTNLSHQSSTTSSSSSSSSTPITRSSQPTSPTISPSMMRPYSPRGRLSSSTSSYSMIRYSELIDEALPPPTCPLPPIPTSSPSV
ncbi:uncharacterized protein BX664DRAFT_385840 [Halteromyces radiatus]|uniref:uncharacterized protein n=1 Tax=Halteromyces radiatus TaxID=101107 RepID=UPI00221EE296|nr:uncharacterized protein BX664DRAFT_385840 [Halteromyces radiatus]KAI8089338.1 hypothetical protein BX664DRAFT_385840 [Halteromyces radiatus]